MIYRITVINGRKYATAVKSREEFLALRDSSENLANLAKARQGDESAKKNLVQFANNLGHVDGLLLKALLSVFLRLRQFFLS